MRPSPTPPRPRRPNEPATCRQTPRLPERINGVEYELVLVPVAGEWALTWRRCSHAPSRPRHSVER